MFSKLTALSRPQILAHCDEPIPRLSKQLENMIFMSFLSSNPGGGGGGGGGGGSGHSGTEGGRTFVTYFADEGVFF